MSQKGNALWFILVAIGLLGLLTVMMTRSSSNSNETGSYEQTVIKANDFLSYTKSIENGVQSLLARSCSENELSFWHDSNDDGVEDASDDYYNIGAPTNRSCHVFDVAGAGLKFAEPRESWLDSNESAQAKYGEITFTGSNQVSNLETNSRSDLLIITSWLTKDICESINNTLFSDPVITEDNGSFSTTPFTSAAFRAASFSNINLTTFPLHDGQPSGCFTSEDDGGYHFYHALHAR